MAVINITDFSGGLNTKDSPHQIKPNESVEATNIDPKSKSLKPMLGVDTSTEVPTADAKYYFNSSWYVEATATSFQEFNKILYYSLTGSKPQRVVAGSAKRDMGVIAPNGTLPTGVASPTTSTYDGTANACYILKIHNTPVSGSPPAAGSYIDRVVVGATSGSTAKISSTLTDTGPTPDEHYVFIRECYGWTVDENVNVYSTDLTSIDHVWNMTQVPIRDYIKLNNEDDSNYDAYTDHGIVGNYINAKGNSTRFTDTAFYKIAATVTTTGDGGDETVSIPDYKGVRTTKSHAGAGGYGEYQAGPYLFKPGTTVVDFQVKVSAVDDQGVESSPSTASAKLTLEAVSQSITWAFSGVTTASPYISSYNLWRTGGISTIYKLLNNQATIASPADDYTDTTWEANLGIEVNVDDNDPPLSGLACLIEVNGMFFGKIDNTLYASKVSLPNAWPEDGLLEFEYAITGIGKLGGEAVVFTANSAYRVRGVSPTALVRSKILGEQGVPSGASNAIVNVGQILTFISNDGICAYDGSSIRVVTEDYLDTFTAPTNPVAEVKDNIVYFLGSAGTGYILDARYPVDGLRIYNTDINATMLHYRNNDDQLFTNAGEIGGAAATSLDMAYKTGELVGDTPDDINQQKVFHRYGLTYSLGTGETLTCQYYVDTVLQDTLVLTSPRTDVDTFVWVYLDDAELGYATSVRFSGKGVVKGCRIHYDALEQYAQKVEFVSATVWYEGNITLTIEIDGTAIINASALSSSAQTSTNISLNTEGHIPHFFGADGDNIIGVYYHTKAI